MFLKFKQMKKILFSLLVLNKKKINGFVYLCIYEIKGKLNFLIRLIHILVFVFSILQRELYNILVNEDAQQVLLTPDPLQYK